MKREGRIAFRTGYLDSAFDNLPEVIERARQQLADVEFDTLVGTGLSGALVVPALALAMGKSFVIVRKEGDGSHHNGKLVGNLGSSWVFVDDFISTGATRRRVAGVILTEASARDRSHKVRYVGDYLYAKYSCDQECNDYTNYDYCNHPGRQGVFTPAEHSK